MKMIELWPRFVFGPYIMKKFGKPATVMPRYARAPPAHSDSSDRPSRPSMRIGTRNAVDWNPVAKISTSAGWVAPSRVTIPSSVTWSMPLVTSSTFSRPRA